MTNVDVLISGGGIAGLSLAAALNHVGLSVMVVDPGRAGVDLRSTAYLLPARDLFEEVGVWDALAPHTTALQALRVVDTTGWPPDIRETRTFTPTELDASEFGWNIPNEVARQALVDHLVDRPGITLNLDVGFKSMLTRTNEARATLTDGHRVRAKLIVAADGRTSPVREAAGIGLQTTRYGQKALAFHAAHEIPHGNISTEIYNQGGAFTTVPLPDQDNQHRSAIVWMNDGPQAKALAAMDKHAFNSQMTIRACGLLGQMQALNSPNVWPVVTQRALTLTAERVVVLAEAAHVLPPIGAQGLNTSLNDVRALFDLVKRSPDALGSAVQLAAYEKARATDTKLRAQAIDLFNRVCKSGSPVIQAARTKGMRLAHDFAPLRHGLMRAGMGNTR